jgi:hypothetical protein
MKKSFKEFRDTSYRAALLLLWLALLAHMGSIFFVGLPHFFSSLCVLLFLICWVHWTRSLGLIGSALLGALVVSSLMDLFLSWGFKTELAFSLDSLSSFVAPLLGLLVGLALFFFGALVLTPRWIAFGLVIMFCLRALLIAPSHQVWSSQLSEKFGRYLLRAGLNVQREQVADFEALFPKISEQEMPCGMMSYRVSTQNLQIQNSEVKLYVKECGFHPQGLALGGGVFSLEIHNALPRALELRLSPRLEDGDYAAPRSFVVPPESYIEVSDLDLPPKGAVLIYAPLEPLLGSALLVDPSLKAEWRVSREPLGLERQ